jgi:GNAT superfamily N-acetyltransferase
MAPSPTVAAIPTATRGYVRCVHAPLLLQDHLRDWLGEWPPPHNGITVVSSPHRTAPGWDGDVRDFVGVTTPTGAVISVPEHAVDAVAKLAIGPDVESALKSLHEHRPQLGDALGRHGSLGAGLFRWSDSPTAMPDVGDWVPTDDVRVPEWLKPFNGDVLIAWDDEGNYGAGVGRKQHDRWGHEISVGTEESLRGRGLARQLVTTAARRILADDAIPTYLHALDNHASAKVADASGFPDVGWRILGFWGS